MEDFTYKEYQEDLERQKEYNNLEEIERIEKKMEEMANTPPTEGMGKRTPGERNKYEERNLALANGMLLHNDHKVNDSKRSSLTAPTVLRYPRGG